MKSFIPPLVFALVWGILPSLAAGQDKPPLAPVHPVVDDYFGIQVADPYRYMENLNDPEVQSWLKAQADYARAVLDRIPGRGELLADIEKYVNAAPALVGDVSRLPGGRYFFIKTLAGQNIGKLFMRQGVEGQDRLLVDTDRFTGPHGEPPTISYYEPSFDGRHVAYGISQGGSEMATLHVVDADTGKDLDESIDRTEFGGVSWRPDNRSFYYNRLQKLAAGDSAVAKYEKSMMYLHHLGEADDRDTAIFGYGLSPAVSFTKMDIPYLGTQPGCDYVIGNIDHGVQNEMTLYVAPLASAGGSDAPWVKICDVDANATEYAIHGDDLYLLSHDDAPRFKILRTSLAHPDVANATVVVPQGKTVLRDIDAAADALYVRELDGGIYHILRVPYDGTPSQLKLPFEGTAYIDSTDPRLPGIVFSLTAWTKASKIFEYDPAANQVNLTTLQPAGPYDDLDELTSIEVQAPSVVSHSDCTLSRTSLALRTF